MKKSIVLLLGIICLYCCAESALNYENQPEYREALKYQSETESLVILLSRQKEALIASNDIPFKDKVSKVQYQTARINSALSQADKASERTKFVKDSIKQSGYVLFRINH